MEIFFDTGKLTANTATQCKIVEGIFCEHSGKCCEKGKVLTGQPRGIENKGWIFKVTKFCVKSNS